MGEWVDRCNYTCKVWNEQFRVIFVNWNDAVFKSRSERIDVGLMCSCTRNGTVISPGVMARMRCCYHFLNQLSQLLYLPCHWGDLPFELFIDRFLEQSANFSKFFLGIFRWINGSVAFSTTAFIQWVAWVCVIPSAVP